MRSLTLAEWADKNRIRPFDHNGCMVVPAYAGPIDPDKAQRDLFILTDYFVSSVMGGSVYLCRRPSAI